MSVSAMKTSLMDGVGARATIVDWDWARFTRYVRECSVPQDDESEDNKRNSPSFSCVEYSPPRRGLANLHGRLWAVVLDLDKITSPGAVLEALVNYRYVAWTTWNSTEEKPAWRIVLPVAGGLLPTDLNAVVNRLARDIGRAAVIDTCSRDAAHLWFLPWHKASSRDRHRIWVNDGDSLSVPRVIHVDFTGVPSGKAENVGEGSRNVALHRHLGTMECLRAKTQSDLLRMAREFNSRLDRPLKDSEVRETANKKWKWLTTTGEGVKARAKAVQTVVDDADVDGLLIPLTFAGMLRTAAPEPLVGNFLFPGVTLVTAKMKEGKSFLAAQLSVSIASGEPFLGSKHFPGYAVRERRRVVIVAGEDTPWLIAQRYGHNMAAGHLPKVEDGMISVVFPERLQELREKAGEDVSGLMLLERLIESWYKAGVRVVCLDPLRITEAMLGISDSDYPGGQYSRNIHTRDLLTTAYFQRLATRFEGLCILISLHHGKNKRGQDATDPGDMIAGTTGLGAGAGATISLLPPPLALGPDDDDEDPPKRRELYIHGRVVRETRMLIEQDKHTGLWSCLGAVRDREVSEARDKYLEALKRAGGAGGWVPAAKIASEAGGKEGTVHKVLSRALKAGIVWKGYRLIRAMSKGYKLI